MAEQEQRPMRMCDVCGGVDDHPRHVFGHAPGDGVTSDAVAAKALQNTDPDNYLAVVAQVRDDSTTYRHMDCCRSVGCPDGSCNVVTQGAEDLQGMALVEHLTSRGGQ